MMQIVVALYIEAFEQFHLIIQHKENSSVRHLAPKRADMPVVKGSRLKKQVSHYKSSNMGRRRS